MVAFTQETKYYSGTRAGVIDQMDNTLGYMFINTGANTLYINGLKLLSGEFYNSFSPPFVDRTLYRYTFDENTGEGAVNNYNFLVIEYQAFN